MDSVELFKVIKRSICDVTSYKLRGDVLEVITGFITLNSRAVSVFIKEDRGKFIVTDNGWVESNYYENPLNDESEDVENKIIDAYIETYSIKLARTRTDLAYYYKSTTEIGQVPSLVFDVANFILGAVNARCIAFKDPDEVKERDKFRSEANRFFTGYYRNVNTRASLDDTPSAKFGAIINIRSRLYLVMYITGSNPYYFQHDINKTIVNFELSERSKYNEIVEERIAIMNDDAAGYHPSRYASVIDLVNEKSTKPALTWSEREQFLEYVPPTSGRGRGREIF